VREVDQLTEQMRALLEQFGGSALKLWKETGILLPIAGGAKGYNETGDILTRTVDGVPFDQLYGEINETLRILNSQRSPLIEFLTFPVENPFEQVMQIISDEFEEADEFGQPKGIRLGRPWNMGFDLKYFDLGIRYTFRFLGRAPAAEIRALNNSALEADQRLIYKTMMDQLLTNQTRAATLEDSGTVVNVYPFYNGDQTALPAVPPAWKSYTHLNTHTHYITSGGATVNSGDLDDMWDHIYHHGYTQGATVFLLVNREQSKTIRKFRVTANDAYDFLPAPTAADANFRGTLVGSLPGAAGGTLGTFPGFIGTYGDIYIIEEDYLPAKYMVMFASGGRFAQRNPIGLREHDHAGLRGLKLIPQFERYPLRESFYHHAIGSGTRHPGAGVVMFVDAGATYVVPPYATQGPGGR
jgi:hypothetical protein